MRILRFERDGEMRLGAAVGDDVVDLAAALDGELDSESSAALADTTVFILADGSDLAKRAIESGKARQPLASVRLLAPIMPGIILCSGENYWDHRAEKPEVTAKEPEFFIKIPTTGVIGPGDSILLDPHVTSKLDYETELAIVIGKAGRHIEVARAYEHIFGYTIMNDVTARDRQVKMRADGTCQYALGPGKNFDTCAPLGPVIVTADELGDPQKLALRTTVNGELRQNNSTAKMIWGPAELVKYFSTFLTLQPGWVISTGTPGGTAWGSDPELGGRDTGRDDVARASGYLAPGDRVVCEIEGIGRLENPVAAAP